MNNENLSIATHSGNFQADDVLAVAILRLLYPELTLVRTRDKAKLSKATFVVDVGGVYDHAALRYDHHQTGGGGSRENGIRYSACGLVWKHYGAHVCHSQEVADRVDAHFIQSIDATDNGQHLYEGGHSNFPGVRGSSFSSMIASLNPTWDEEPSYDGRFIEAVEIATIFLVRAIAAANGAAKAEARVLRDIRESPDPRVILLSESLPWQETVVNNAPEALYIVYKSEAGTWMAQGTPVSLGSFKTKHSPPSAWGGKDEASLRELTGVEDVVFVHNNLFIMGAGSLQGILQLVNLSLIASSQKFASYYEETPDENGEFVLVLEATEYATLREIRRAGGRREWHVKAVQMVGVMEFGTPDYNSEDDAQEAARSWYARTCKGTLQASDLLCPEIEGALRRS